MSDSYRRKTAALRLCFHLIVIIEVGAETHYHSTLTVSVPHMSYICPEGANVTMQCVAAGTTRYAGDQVKFGWLFTAHQDQRCQDDTRPRIPHSKNHSHARAEGVYYQSTRGVSWITLVNVAHADQGRYCCVALDIHREAHRAVVEQKPHNHVLLTITPRRPGNTNCTVIDHKPPEGSVAAGLATAGCIMGILSLPLILLLVYKQRQTAQSNRRAHELVRMDSEAQGHENPVFLGGSPQNKTRTVSQIMTRQSSETGRHLLSEPNTPLSPPVHGDVFFPSQEPIPESPDFMQV
ncbi:V-type immunoglobulin domain-containing suppressor of T-cell activation [Anguilla anguilla]|uniref:V-type immunoglobulin domain-containing suppressor of T-cell activation n=1 Tax=Anguilla anguilla TaxID=7936 RepID=UPI0015AA04B2|nr:V-type immunoglobulin domain-containing suppressor of T-cell activation [Anguilla anguilla]